MASKHITDGWRGFSTAKESSYNGSATVDETFNFEGEPSDIEVNSEQTNGNEVTGYNEPTEHEILNYKLDGSHQQRCLPHNVAQFAGMVMGKVTTDQPDAVNNSAVYQHWFERDLVNVALPSFSMVEYNGVLKKIYDGIFGKKLMISGSRGEYVNVDFEFGGSGKETTSALARPTAVAESYLRYGDVEFQRGGALSGTVAGGDLAHGSSPTSFKANLQSFEWSIENQAETFYEMGDNTGYVSRVERGDSFIQSLKAVIEMQDDGHKTGLTAGTEYVMSIPIVGSAITGSNTDGSLNYTVDIIFPKVVYREAKIGRDGNRVVINADWQILEDTTFGSVIVRVRNKQVAYLT